MHTQAHVLTTSPTHHLHLIVAVAAEPQTEALLRIVNATSERTKCVLVAHSPDEAVTPGSVCRFIPGEDRFVLCGTL